MIEMNQLVEMLDSGGHSCVIANGDEIRTFALRGVADLHRLSREEPHFLRGAVVADKVVGKGAAALMASCGVQRLYSHIVSDGALSLLSSVAMAVEYGERVDHIINRDKSGWCPVEALCRNVDSIDEILKIVDRFLDSINNRTSAAATVL
ncbi:MAG: DUF1893 domain-containing protein [Rikenellaceae bacterium]